MTSRYSKFYSVARNLLHKPSTLFWLIFFVHFALAVFYMEVVGLDIQANPRWRPWDWWWQMLSQEQLVNDLWRNIWYLHSQPPLFNLYGAFFFNLFPAQPMPAMQYVNILLGSLISGMIYLTMFFLTGRKLPSLVAGLILALDPGLYLFESYILYDILTTFFIVASVCLFAAYVHTSKLGFGALFVLALSLLILTRSAYHLLVIPIGMGLAALSIPKNAKKLVVVGLVISLLPVGWYAKNYFQFGFFGTSSWLGFSIWQTVSQGYTPEQLADYRDQGIVEAVAVEVEVWRTPSRYVPYGFDQKSDIPALNQEDHNNINMIPIAKAYHRSGAALIKRDPERLLQTVLNSYLIFNIPSAQFKHHVLNADKIQTHVWFYSQVLQGRFLERFVHYPIGSLFFFLVPISVVAYVSIFIYESIWRKKTLFAFLRDHAVESWIIFLIVYTTLIGILLEVGENNRERFYIEQLVLVYLLVIANRMLPALRNLLAVSQARGRRQTLGREVQ